MRVSETKKNGNKITKSFWKLYDCFGGKIRLEGDKNNKVITKNRNVIFVVGLGSYKNNEVIFGNRMIFVSGIGSLADHN